MRLVLVSDTHSLHDCCKVPKGDVLIHAGDLTNIGSMEDIIKFNEWIGKIKCRHKLVIAGNHDWGFERNPGPAKKLLTNCTYLMDKKAVIDGVVLFGSPWSPEFCNWAFNLPRGKPLRDKWNKIPENVDVLITHGPPDGILDETEEGNRTGCADLLDVVQKIKPKIHVFGHIHEGYGQVKHGGTTFVNASICTRRYHPVNEPIVVDL